MREPNFLPHSGFKMHKLLGLLCASFFVFMMDGSNAYAACAATNTTWQATGSTNWNQGGNWTNGKPTSDSFNAIITNTGSQPIAITTTVSCLEVQSGFLKATSAKTITITGDYFRATTPESLSITNDNFTIHMAGTTPQTLEIVDEIRDLTISNPTTVTTTNPFIIESELSLSGNGTLIINDDIYLDTSSIKQVIPAGFTVIIANGATVFAKGGLDVFGTLKIQAGGTLRIKNNKYLSINSGAVIQMNGANGNPARLISDGEGEWFYFEMQGNFSAEHFYIARMRQKGMEIEGTVSAIDNGEFHFIKSNAAAMTIKSGSTMPSTMSSIGFFDDHGYANNDNIDADDYSGAVITISPYSGNRSGESYDVDSNNKISWGTKEATELFLINNSKETQPPQTISDDSIMKTFGVFAFNLTDVDTSTDITEITITMTGNAAASDIETLQIWDDASEDCNYGGGGGPDAQIGSDLVLTGTPPKVTVTIPAGRISTDGSTQGCFSLRASTSTTAQHGKWIAFGVMSTGHVTNSQGYVFSSNSGPPLENHESEIVSNNGTAWSGASSKSMIVDGNWDNNAPNCAISCTIGASVINDPQVSADPVSCLNAYLLGGAVLDFNNTSNRFQVCGQLEIGASFDFQNATDGIIEIAGSATQSVVSETSFPGDLTINNTGISGNDIISIDSDWTILGDVIVTDGVLRISSPYTLKVCGNLTVQTGAELIIDPGATLEFCDGSVLTIDAGATLTMEGTSANRAVITTASNTAGYTVVVNGTIAADYYTFNHLGTGGVTIGSGATIDASSHLQNGTFAGPIGNNPTLLTLLVGIPGNSLTGMEFDTGDTSPTGTVTNISTVGATATMLTISNHSGSFTGAIYDDDQANFLVNWGPSVNTIQVTNQNSGPGTVSTGQTYNMGTFGFKQTVGDVSFADANVTSLTLTMTGTGTGNDVDALRIYYDANCDGTSGSLIGTGTFAGTPPTSTFTITSGDFLVPQDNITTQMRCLYVEYDIASTATNGATVGVSIAANTDLVNDQSYAISGQTSAPISLGTEAIISVAAVTIWTGSDDSDWSQSNNWTNGVPSCALNCEIPDVGNDPIIGNESVSCKNLNITNGTLTFNHGSGELSLCGNLTNTGTIAYSGGGSAADIIITDDGSGSDNALKSSSTINNLIINKTNGGTVSINNSFTIATLDFPTTGGDFNFQVNNGYILTLTNDIAITSGSFIIDGGATLKLDTNADITVSGTGSFSITGTNDTFPQVTTNKGMVTTVSSSDDWGFTATAGTVSLTGFLLDRLNTAGLNIGGTTVLTAMNGGQFTNLPTNYSNTTVMQINTTGSIPVSATNIAWTWDSANNWDDGVANTNTPANNAGYFINKSASCNGQTMSVENWTGDWFEDTATFDVDTVRDDPNDCVVFGSSSSAVSLLSLAAVPYNGAINILWQTNVEQNHLGFNVYRSDVEGGEFLQINGALIRNFNSSTTGKGDYTFVDQDVTNGQRYYYYIEDVATNLGDRELHGPIWATPLATLASAPLPGATDNGGINAPGTPGGGSSSTISNPSYKNLGNGVEILSQTSKTLRIQIQPGTPTFTTSAWHGAYQDMALAGHAQTTVAGAPANLQRTLLIEVNPFTTTAAITQSSKVETSLSNHLLAPVPHYAPDINGQLAASFNPDNATYTTSVYSPSNFFSLENNLLTVGGRKFIKLTINPTLYNPVLQSFRLATKIILDIGLDGNSWQIDPTPIAQEFNAHLVANTLRISYTAAGMYEVSYDEMFDTNVEGPFDNEDTYKFRLYYKNQQIPMEVISATGNFRSGDKVRFYAPYERSIDDDHNQIILSAVPLDDAATPLRIEALNGNPLLGESTAYENNIRQVTAEKDLLYLDREAIGDSGDHFVWGRLISSNGFATLSMPVELPNLSPTAQDWVKVTAHIIGNAGNLGDVTHHLGVYINGSALAADVTFNRNIRESFAFYIPSSLFNEGSNTVTLKAEGTYAGADLDWIYVDRIEVEYAADFSAANNGRAVFENSEWGSVISLTGFTNNDISVYDYTLPLAPRKLANIVVTTPDAGTTYSAQYYADYLDYDSFYGTHYWVAEAGSFLTPAALTLSTGYEKSLKDSNNSADMLVIGNPSLTLAANELIGRRIAQGLQVMTVAPQQIYAEFSAGRVSSAAIRDFVQYALASWAIPRPKFLLLIGDATNDPRDRNIYDLTLEERSSLELGTMPMPIMAGQFVDFGGDNYFAASANSHLPQIAVGRLPSNDPSIIQEYAEKIISYEEGSSAPDTYIKKLLFVADESKKFEKFREKMDALAAIPTSVQASAFSAQIIDRGLLSSAHTKSAIIAAVNEGPLLMTMIGHGAYDRWGNNDFNISDVLALNNSQLPIALVLNCENSFFYDHDKSYDSLGENFIFNPNGGAIAFLGSTTQTVPAAQMRLATALYQEITSTVQKPFHQARLGELIQRAKISMGTSAHQKDVINSFSLFGDPAMVLPKNLFPTPAPVVVEGPKIAAAGAGGGGCSAGAATGRPIPSTQDGLLEIISLLCLYFFTRKFVLKLFK